MSQNERRMCFSVFAILFLDPMPLVIRVGEILMGFQDVALVQVFTPQF